MSLGPFSRSIVSSYVDARSPAARAGSPGSSRAAGKRGAPRHRQHALTCNLGEVVDLSTSGARIRCRHPAQGHIDVALTDYFRAGELRGEVVWMKPVGNFHYDIGVRFCRLTRDMASRLNSIAMTHRFRRAG